MFLLYLYYESLSSLELPGWTWLLLISAIGLGGLTRFVLSDLSWLTLLNLSVSYRHTLVPAHTQKEDGHTSPPRPGALNTKGRSAMLRERIQLI